MMYEHYHFTRNPIVEDHVFFLESKCIRCRFTVLAHSVEELVEAEKDIARYRFLQIHLFEAC